MGPGWVRETHDYMSIPLLVRPNTILAVGGREDRPDYDYSDDITLHVYQLEDGEHVRAVVPGGVEGEEIAFEVHRTGQVITVDRQGKTARWRLLLAGIASVAEVDGGAHEAGPRGTLITPTGDVERLRIAL